MKDIELSKHIKIQDKLMIIKHLSTLLSSGVTITESIETIRDQSTSSFIKRSLGSIADDINNGQTLAEAAKDHPKIFDEFSISLMEIGEESGTLEQNLKFLAVQITKDNALKRKISSALLYPGFVMGTMVVMGGFIAIFILPQLLDFFGTLDIELPLSTKILIFIAEVMQNHGVTLFGVSAALLIMLFFAIKHPLIKPHWHSFLLKIPVIGNLFAYTQLSRFSRNLGTLLTSGVPITRALETVEKTLTNMQYKMAIRTVNDAHSEGKGIGDSLNEESKELFPPIVTKMVQIGEKTGKLEDTLVYLGEFYDEEIDVIAKNLTTILEPLMLAIIGIGVAVLAIAIIGPIYDITGAIPTQ